MDFLGLLFCCGISFFGTMEDRMELTFGHELCLLCRHCYDQIRIDIEVLLVPNSYRRSPVQIGSCSKSQRLSPSEEMTVSAFCPFSRSWVSVCRWMWGSCARILFSLLRPVRCVTAVSPRSGPNPLCYLPLAGVRGPFRGLYLQTRRGSVYLCSNSSCHCHD